MRKRMRKRNSPFNVGDVVMFLGSDSSQYGYKASSDKYIGLETKITGIHPDVEDPYAYRMDLDKSGYWYAENCFDAILMPDLPEFAADMELDMLLL